MPPGNPKPRPLIGPSSEGFERGQWLADAHTSLEAWKSAAATGAAPADARLYKTYTPYQIKAEGEPDSRRLTFTISTGAVDRDNDTLAVDGWDVQDYLKNPVLLWAHDAHMPPIGKALAVVKRGSALHATFEFAPGDVYPLAEQVYQLLKGGFLRATSVGFLPQEWTYDEQRGGFNFKKQALLEVSVVPVPSNPQALLEAKGAGLETGAISKWATEWLKGTEPPPVPPAAPPATIATTFPAVSTKAGRVLSSANESRVKAARDACQKACDHLDEVMAEVMPMGGPEDPEEEGKSAPAAAPAQPRIVVKRTRPEESQAERVERVVREVVRATVAAEIRRLTGRLD